MRVPPVRIVVSTLGFQPKNTSSILVRVTISGNSSFDRASAFQAEGGGFEPRFPLISSGVRASRCMVATHDTAVRFRPGTQNTCL